MLGFQQKAPHISVPVSVAQSPLHLTRNMYKAVTTYIVYFITRNRFYILVPFRNITCRMSGNEQTLLVDGVRLGGSVLSDILCESVLTFRTAFHTIVHPDERNKPAV